MKRYTISNTSSGHIIGTFKGLTELEAYQAMMTDAGYKGAQYVEIPDDISVEEMSE